MYRKNSRRRVKALFARLLVEYTNLPISTPFSGEASGGIVKYLLAQPGGGGYNLADAEGPLEPAAHVVPCLP